MTSSSQASWACQRLAERLVDGEANSIWVMLAKENIGS
jgi:hypothetical protein